MNDRNQNQPAISLHIGINNVDTDYYGNNVSPLEGCLNDMNNMEAFAKKLGYQTYALVDGEATKQAIQQKIMNLGNKVKDGGILLITYAGAWCPTGRQKQKRQHGWRQRR